MSKESEKSLKAANQPKLITFMVINVVAVAIAVSGTVQILSLLSQAGKGDWALLFRVLGLPAVGTLAVGLLGWLIPRTWKEVLVFWRFGERRLPSSEAFTVIAPAELRIDMDQLTNRLGPLPTENAKQNTLWYSVYRKHCKEAAVNDANSAYLLYRDMAAIVPLLLAAGNLLGVVLGASVARIAALFVGICFEFLLLVLACRNAGRRLVANVLAIEAGSAEESGKKLISP